MSRGVVSWFSEEKGFGFVTDADGGHILVNYTSILSNGNGDLGFRSLDIGREVEFEVVKNAHGRPLAANVRVLEASEKITDRGGLG